MNATKKCITAILNKLNCGVYICTSALFYYYEIRKNEELVIDDNYSPKTINHQRNILPYLFLHFR